MSLATADLHDLRDRCEGVVISPSEEGWDGARQAWNLAVDQRPVAVAVPAHEADVAQIVAFARDAGLRVAPQTTGHNAGPLGSLEATILLKTSALDQVRIDPVHRRARVGGGALWQDVMGPANAHG